MAFKSAVTYALIRLRDVLFYCVVVGVLWTALPILETRFFPVIHDMQIKNIAYDDDGDVRFVTEFQKTRDCNYRGSSWYLGTPLDTFTRANFKSFINAQYNSPDERLYDYYTRPLGRQVAGPWEIVVPDDQKERKQFFGVLRYSCGFPWYTVQLLGPFAMPVRAGTPQPVE